MKFATFLNESTGLRITAHQRAEIIKELHNGNFGSEHRHIELVNKSDHNTFYILSSYEIDAHMIGDKDVKVGDHVYEIFEFDSITLGRVKSSDIQPTNIKVITDKDKAEKLFNSLK